MLLVQDPKTTAMNFDSGANDYCTINSELVDKYKDQSTFKQIVNGYLFYLQPNFENEALEISMYAKHCPMRSTARILPIMS